MFQQFRHLTTALTAGVAGMCMALFPQLAHAQADTGRCGSLTNGFGPHDYRPERYVRETTYRSHAALMHIVETEHFTRDIENLRKGKNTPHPGGDLDYLLRAIPNHHRGLVAVVKLGEKEKTPQPKGMRYPIDCWFERAIQFRSDDNIVRMLFAQYLHKAGQVAKAEQQLQVVDRQASDNPFTQFNIGRLYLDMGKFDSAVIHAKRAQAMGFGNLSLIEQLKAAGKWTSAASAPEAGAAASAASSASASAP